MDNQTNKTDLTLQLLFVSILTGLFCGVVITLYNAVATIAEEFSRNYYNVFFTNPGFIPLLFAALFLGSIIAGGIRKALPIISGSGIPQIEGAARGVFHFKWIQSLMAMFAASLLSVFMGLSAGCEGPSVFIGGSCGALTSNAFKRNAVIRRYLISGGACAGLAVAFNAPLAGIIHAFEDTHKRFSPELFICSFASVCIAVIVRNVLRPLMGLSMTPILANFSFDGADTSSLYFLLYAVPCSIIIAFAGVAFYYIVFALRKLIAKYKFFNGIFGFTLTFLLAGAFGLVSRYSMGGGVHFIEALGSGDIVGVFATPVVITVLIAVAVKFIATVINVSSGVPSGALVPILAIGAGMGYLVSYLCKLIGMDDGYQCALIIICMATFFSTVVRSPLTSVVLVLELTWKFTFLLPLICGVAIGYFIGILFRTQPLYDRLFDEMVISERKEHPIQYFTVKIKVSGSLSAVDRQIRNIMWPNGAVVALVERNGESFVPSGATELREDDILTIKAKTYYKENFIQSLQSNVGKVVIHLADGIEKQT
ncbi:MAG: chloride channel protein [Candidatus Coproplasma sp.]